jgi:hypothetical protein
LSGLQNSSESTPHRELLEELPHRSAPRSYRAPAFTISTTDTNVCSVVEHIDIFITDGHISEESTSNEAQTAQQALHERPKFTLEKFKEPPPTLFTSVANTEKVREAWWGTSQQVLQTP